MEYTQKQKQAIYTQQNAVLVSAAAGSGKTSVLARRVAELVKDGADIRRMLVMTFTNAAAAEMRRRIAAALYDEAAGSGDKRLMEQSELVAAADISTFHSFCARAVREHYAAADVSPNFKILSETESDALKSAVLREYFDLLYERQDQDFLRLLARFTTRADDARLAATMLRVYDRMMGQPQPFEWALASANEPLERYVPALVAAYDAIMLDKLEDAYALLRTAADTAAMYCEKQAADDDATVAQMDALMACARQDMGKARQRFAGCAVPAIKRGAAPEVAALTGGLRKEARALLKEVLSDNRAGKLAQTIPAELAHTREDVRALVELIRTFDRMYAVKKRGKNALDYEDLQHKALALLDGAKDEFRARYDHIFVDEYQDTNPLQEEIVQAIHCDANKLFMVGDIKQSIYKFRQADPGIFRRKAALFGGGAGEIIMMNDNFRSAGEVIGAVNFVMERIMCERLGEVAYTGGERLVATAPGGGARVLLCEGGGVQEDEDGTVTSPTQAEMIAASIEAELQSPVTDRKTGGERRLTPGDIAVLMRSRSALTQEIRRALLQRCIPCVVSMKSVGDPPETVLFINLLKLAVNPLQDVPLLSVMRSFIGGFNETDFACIRLYKNDDSPFHAAVYAYAETADGELAERLRSFLAELETTAQRAHSGALPQFIPALAERYDFHTYLLGTPGGGAKQELFTELLAQLTERAADCGNSLYRLLEGLEETRKRTGGYVQAAETAARADCVRIMTIHGSKGLEFPVVYVAGLEKRFNTRDLREDFMMQGELGVTASYVDEQTREKFETAEQFVLRDQLAAENRSEELRMLYVAMTRARERLVLTGAVKDLEQQAEKWRSLAGRYGRASCMLDWIMAANHGKDALRVEIYTGGGTAEAAPAATVRIRERAAGAQPAELVCIEPKPAVPAKVSVSAVKRQAHAGIRSFLSPQVDEDAEITGARLGTLVHSLMERAVVAGSFDAAAAQLLERNLVTTDEHAALLQNRAMVDGFLQSELYARMQKSPRQLLEQPFNLRVDAGDVGYAPGEPMLVQGILDAAFLENGAWVLVDYKTDRVEGEALQEAAEGYRVQLALYARALTEITGLPVAEQALYFLRPGVCVRL